MRPGTRLRLLIPSVQPTRADASWNGTEPRRERTVRTQFHREITRRALAPYFTDEAVEIALRANDSQDNLRGQIAHPEYHVDNAVAPGYAFMLGKKQQAKDAFGKGHCIRAIEALGCCLHTVQDFYSHSNYVKLWLEANGGVTTDPASIPLLLDWLTIPELRTGRATLQEGLTYLPWIGKLFARMLTLPADSHAALNLDGPHRGPEFAFALEAARKHSEHIAAEVNEEIVHIAPALSCLRRSETPLA